MYHCTLQVVEEEGRAGNQETFLRKEKIMSKKRIDFSAINPKAKAQLEAFAAARIEIAKEDIRHKGIMKHLNNQLEAIKENRDLNLRNGMKLEEVLVQFPTIEVEKAINKENILHKEIMKPLNEELTSTYAFVPKNLYYGYKLKIESGKRGEFLLAVKTFLVNIGVKDEDISQSALCKLSERISDWLGVTVSKSKILLEHGNFSSVVGDKQFYRLFMSVFCDMLAMETSK